MPKIKVPYGLDVSISIRREGDTAFVDVFSPMYIVKEWTMQHSYAVCFTDMEIIRDGDFIKLMFQHYPG